MRRSATSKWTNKRARLAHRAQKEKGRCVSAAPLFYSGLVPRNFWNVLPADSAALARASIVKTSFQWRASLVKTYKFRGVVDLEKIP
jgi:hypothetical protein